MSAYTTEEALYDALYLPDYSAKVAAAIDGGDLLEAGRLMAAGVAAAKKDREEIDQLRAEEVADALDDFFPGLRQQLDDLSVLAPRLAIVPVKGVVP